MSEHLSTYRVVAIDASARSVTSAIMSFEQIQAHVGGYVEPVYAPLRERGAVVLVDEEAALKPLRAPAIAVNGHVLIGNAIVVGLSEEDFADCPLSIGEVQAMLRFEHVDDFGDCAYQQALADVDRAIRELGEAHFRRMFEEKTIDSEIANWRAPSDLDASEYRAAVRSVLSARVHGGFP